MKDKDSKKLKQAKIVRLNHSNSQSPLDLLLKDLEQINKTLESHWTEEQEEGNQGDINLSGFSIWKNFELSFQFFRTKKLSFRKPSMIVF